MDQSGPLYQSAYLLGALQFRAMHRELVDSKKMTDRAVSRCDSARELDARRIAARRSGESEIDAGLQNKLEILRRASVAERYADRERGICVPWLLPGQGRVRRVVASRIRPIKPDQTDEPDQAGSGAGCQIEAIRIHDLGPGSNEVLHEGFLRIAAPVDLSNGAELRV